MKEIITELAYYVCYKMLCTSLFCSFVNISYSHNWKPDKQNDALNGNTSSRKRAKLIKMNSLNIRKSQSCRRRFFSLLKIYSTYLPKSQSELQDTEDWLCIAEWNCLDECVRVWNWEDPQSICQIQQATTEELSLPPGRSPRPSCSPSRFRWPLASGDVW